jgi:acetylornithine deacetylase/succinyl-diaminopimelate desuccinylase-like protein
MLDDQTWSQLIDHVDANQDQAIERLSDLIRIPTVAHPAIPNPALEECAQLIRSWLERIGATDVQIVTPAVNPLVVGQLGDDPGKPTVLIYNHMDVQAPGPDADWDTPPFEPVIRNNRLYGRGSGDNKGQFLAHLLAIEAYQALGIPLPVNVRFIYDGGEEIGSGDFATFVESSPASLAADYAFTSDGPVHESWRPTMVLGGRGIAYLRVKLRTINRSTHSQYAPVLPNAAWRMVEILNSMRDPVTGRVTIDGFYDEVREPDESDMALLRTIPSSLDRVIEQLAPDPFPKISSEEYYRRLLMEPVLNIAGFAAGDLTGNRTVVPGDVEVKLEALLVPDQDPDHIVQLVGNHLRSWGIDAGDVEVMFTMKPSRTAPDHPMVEHLTEALRTVWDTEPVVMNRFAAYSPYYLFDELGIPGFYIAYAQPDQSNHAPNENLDLTYFRNGILTSIAVLDKFGTYGDPGGSSSRGQSGAGTIS